MKNGQLAFLGLLITDTSINEYVSPSGDDGYTFLRSRFDSNKLSCCEHYTSISATK